MSSVGSFIFHPNTVVLQPDTGTLVLNDDFMTKRYVSLNPNFVVVLIGWRFILMYMCIWVVIGLCSGSLGTTTAEANVSIVLPPRWEGESQSTVLPKTHEIILKWATSRG